MSSSLNFYYFQRASWMDRVAIDFMRARREELFSNFLGSLLPSYRRARPENRAILRIQYIQFLKLVVKQFTPLLKQASLYANERQHGMIPWKMIRELVQIWEWPDENRSVYDFPESMIDHPMIGRWPGIEDFEFSVLAAGKTLSLQSVEEYIFRSVARDDLIADPTKVVQVPDVLRMSEALIVTWASLVLAQSVYYMVNLDIEKQRQGRQGQSGQGDFDALSQWSTPGPGNSEESVEDWLNHARESQQAFQLLGHDNIQAGMPNPDYYFRDAHELIVHLMYKVPPLYSSMGLPQVTAGGHIPSEMEMPSSSRIESTYTPSEAGVSSLSEPGLTTIPDTNVPTPDTGAPTPFDLPLPPAPEA